MDACFFLSFFCLLASRRRWFSVFCYVLYVSGYKLVACYVGLTLGDCTAWTFASFCLVLFCPIASCLQSLFSAFYYVYVSFIIACVSGSYVYYLRCMNVCFFLFYFCLLGSCRCSLLSFFLLFFLPLRFVVAIVGVTLAGTFASFALSFIFSSCFCVCSLLFMASFCCSLCRA